MAKKYKLVYISIWTQPALVLNLYYHLDLLIVHSHFVSHGKVRLFFFPQATILHIEAELPWARGYVGASPEPNGSFTLLPIMGRIFIFFLFI